MKVSVWEAHDVNATYLRPKPEGIVRGAGAVNFQKLFWPEPVYTVDKLLADGKAGSPEKASLDAA